MSGTITGAAFAGALVFTWIAFGFWAFVLVGVAMLVGGFIGRVADNRIDVRALLDVFRGRRSSS